MERTRGLSGLDGGGTAGGAKFIRAGGGRGRGGVAEDSASDNALTWAGRADGPLRMGTFRAGGGGATRDGEELPTEEGLAGGGGALRAGRVGIALPGRAGGGGAALVGRGACDGVEGDAVLGGGGGRRGGAGAAGGGEGVTRAGGGGARASAREGNAGAVLIGGAGAVGGEGAGVDGFGGAALKGGGGALKAGEGAERPGTTGGLPRVGDLAGIL